jgi:hypothetical protein
VPMAELADLPMPAPYRKALKALLDGAAPFALGTAAAE